MCLFVTTAHVMEPPFPGVAGHYVNLGVCYDRQALAPLREDLIQVTRDYKSCYDRAYQRFRAAVELQRSGEWLLQPHADQEKLKKRVQGIVARECKNRKTGRGNPIYRFLGGLSCQGRVTLWDTVFLQCKKVYELRDGRSGLANQMLSQLAEGALQGGYHPVICLSPEDPSRVDHLLLPELSLGFITGGNYGPAQRPYRRIHLESLIEKEAWKVHRNELRFAWRIADELIEDGLRELRRAKERHDQLEELYHPHVDFAKMERMADQLAEEILAM